ncbi:MAG: polysaccharide biosynthesis tyrosine autokinase [Gemmatimonadota bacterium]
MGEQEPLGASSSEPLRIQVVTPSPAPATPNGAHGDDFVGQGPVLRLGEVLGVIRRHVWLIALMTVAFASVAYVVVSRERPIYRANALIRLLDPQQVTQGVTETPRSAAKADPIMSEIVVLTGRAVAGAVVDSLGLRLYDLAEQGQPSWAQAMRADAPAQESRALQVTFSDQLVVASDGKGRARAAYGSPLTLNGVHFTVRQKPVVASADLVVMPRDAAIDMVISGLSARPREGTNALDVSFASAQSRTAIDVVNRVVIEYRTLSASNERQQDRQRLVFLREQLVEYERSLRAAEAEVAAFRSRHQVYRSEERFAAEQEAMLQVEMKRREYESDQRTYQSLLEQLDKPSSGAAALRSLAAATDVAASPVVTKMFTELTALETTRDSLIAAGKLPAHMLVKQIEERIAASERRLADAVRSQVATLGGRVGELQQMLGNSAAEMSKLSAVETEETRLDRSVTSIQQLYERLREEYQLARMMEAVDVSKVQIVDLATRAIPESSPKLLKLMLGAGTGLMLALAIAFLREHMNTSIRRRADIERLLRVPGLAVIPQMRERRRWRLRRMLGSGNGKRPIRPLGVNGAQRRSDTATLFDSLSTSGASQSEVFRSLRARLLLSQSSRTLRTVVVTSAHGEDGKTTTTANLAVAFAQQGFRVVVVDGDMRRPRLHELFDVPSVPGFADTLADLATVDEALTETAIARLHVMPSGTTNAESPDLLKTENLTRVFGSLGKRFDVVLVDSPPLEAVPDAAILAAHADGAIVVLRAGSTERAAARQAVEQLSDVGAAVVGAVLNDPDAEAAKYPDYSSAYNYAT